MKSARRETTSMAEAGRVFVNNKAGGKKQTSSLRERERERSQPHFHRLRMELMRHPRGGGNGDLAGAVREARDQGNAGPDARGTEQQWLSGLGAGAAAAVTTRVARHTLSILS